MTLDLDAAMASVWLHGPWRDLTGRMTTAQREAAAVAVERLWAVNGPEANADGRNDLRWWLDPYTEVKAAYGALSAALDDQEHLGLPVQLALARLAKAIHHCPRTTEG